MNESMQLLLKYPSLLPKNAQRKEFDGYLNINGTDYEIHLSQVNGKPALEINEKLSTFRQDIDDLSNSNTNLLSFLDSLSEIISSKTSCMIKTNMADFYRKVLSEYAEFREFHINLHSCVITPDLSEVSITTVDECNRQHALTVAIDGMFRISRHDLPDRDDFAKPSASLSVLYETFVKAIEELQPYLYLMDRFDSAAWVLDPETPKPKDCYRRIAFDSNISVVITVDPWKPDEIPSLQFLGAERLTTGLRSKVSSNVENWDYKSDTFDEILRLLEMEHFPAKPSVDHGEVVLFSSGECCICFSSRLNEKLPEIVCTNPSCEQFFHAECLHQKWNLYLMTPSSSHTPMASITLCGALISTWKTSRGCSFVCGIISKEIVGYLQLGWLERLELTIYTSGWCTPARLRFIIDFGVNDPWEEEDRDSGVDAGFD